MRITVQTNISGQLAAALADRADVVERVVAEQARKDTSPYVPFLTGSLDNRTRVEGNTIIYPGPYARYLYYGKVMIDPVTKSTYARPGATKVLTDRNLVFTKDFHPQAQAFWFEASKAQNKDKWLRIAQRTAEHGR